MPPATITLTCWIFGDDTDNLLELEIAGSKNITSLKNVIKKKMKQALQNVDEHTLQLWKVSIPLNDQRFEEQLKALSPSNQTPLITGNIVSSYFAEKSDGCLDIVIYVPPEPAVNAPDLLSLNCSLRFDGKPNQFTVKILKNEKVNELKNLIKAKQSPRLNHVVASDLIINPVSVPLGDNLKERLEKAKLTPLDPLDDNFLSLLQVFPSVEDNCIHVVVEVPLIDSDEHRDKRVRVKSPLPHTPLSVANNDPQTPEYSTQQVLRTSANQATQNKSPRIRATEIEPLMLRALKPFTQYITYLAEGKLDGYFSSIQPEELVTDLKMELPTEPMLLLHDLGNNIDMNAIEDLFISDTVHLFAISGSGKTRRTLEGLCHHWGFYITAQTGKIGSRDLESMVDIIKSMADRDNDADTKKPNPEKNASVANRAFAMLICARVFVLKHLLQSLPPNTDVRVARKRWILAQVLPPSLPYGFDIFATIVKSIRHADKDDMLDFARDMLWQADMVKNEELFIVIDEAQVAADYLKNPFRSLTSGTDLRPLLHAFYKFLKILFQGIILAGTGLCLDTVKGLPLSQIAKPTGERQEPNVFVELGQFKGDQIHKDYICKYFSLSTSIFDERLLERISYWFSGRYRFTASLLEVLLTLQPGSPHRILTAFVKSMTKFDITDAIDLQEKEPELTWATIYKIGTYGQFNQIKTLFEKDDRDLIRCLFDAFMRWRIGSETTVIPIQGNLHELVALGVGHLEKAGPYLTLDPRSNYPVYLCEPLIVLFLSSHFNQYFRTREAVQERWISESFRIAHNASSRGFIFEETVLLVLLQKLGGEHCALSDVFDCNQPWGSRKVTLVSLKRVNDSMECCPVSWTSGSSDRLGLKAASPEHVLTFMNNPDGKCFLFPDTHMGPDLLFFLQDVETKELILCGLQCKFSFPKLDVGGWQKALTSVTPDFFYTTNTKNGIVQYAPSKYPSLWDDITTAIKSMVGPNEYKKVEGYWAKLRSSTAVNKQLEPEPPRQTPKYLQLIATVKHEQRSLDDVGVLRRDVLEKFLGSPADVVMGSPSSD